MEANMELGKPLEAWDSILKIIGQKEAVDWVKIVTIGLLLAIFFYVLFALLIVRQVTLMTNFLGTKLSPYIKTFAWIYVCYAVLVLLLILNVF